MIVAMPSKGRAGRITTPKFLSSAVAYVPAPEADSYRVTDGLKVVPVPIEVQGITKTRNWILDHADGEDVVFVDDDCRRTAWIEMLPERCYHRKLDEPVLLQEFENLFDVMRGMGYRLWGAQTHASPQGIYPYKPIMTRSYITASLMGMASDDLRFDETFPVKEDYELCLRCIRDDGGVLAARYFYWENAHWEGEGGCVSYRTERMERIAIARLMARYPGMVRRATKGGCRFSIELST